MKSAVFSNSTQPLAVFEISAFGAALIIADHIDKSASLNLLQAELNDNYGYVLKFTGNSTALRMAEQTAQALAQQMHAPCKCCVINAADAQAWPIILSPAEYQPLIQQHVVFPPPSQQEHNRMPSETLTQSPAAIGLIETQGFTAVIQAIDTACKAANVQVIGKEKLGGGYITVLIQGDVAAVQTAVDAGKAKVNELGKLIAAHVISRPSESVLKLLP